jgi:drug/metabolite transporter (DMT)-like permease
MRLSGPVTMLLGFASFGLAPVFLRLGLLGGWHASGAVVVRFLVALVLTAAITLAAQAFGSGGGELAVRPVNTRGLLWRGVYGGAAVLTYFYSVQLVGAGLGALLNCTYSLWANIFGVMLGRHRPDRWFWPLLTSAGAGLWLIVDVSDAHRSRWGLFIGILSGIAGGAALLTVKTLRATDNAVTINLALTFGGLVVGIPVEAARIASAGAPPAALWPVLFLLVSAVFSFFGQLLFNHGLKHTSVALGSLLALVTPVIAGVCGFLFLAERLTPYFLLGAGLILLACIALGYREALAADS